ncbi:hypothetical protein RUND412_007293 [Rhizina undulata]
MSTNFYPSQRLSYTAALCTVRYVGSVEGTAGEWLGVEWDDVHRGKHSGEREGKKYFECKLPSSGSFIRPTRAPDTPISFLEALRKKYTTAEDDPEPHALISISATKVVEEIGFDKIVERLSRLKELKIVLLDKMRICRADQVESILETCPKIEELDISRNLFEDLDSIATICRGLPDLKALRISGNRLSRFDISEANVGAFKNITSLEMNNTLFSWEEISRLLPHFSGLTTLEATLNVLTSIPPAISAIIPPSTTTINLERNEFSTLSSIFHLSTLPHLHALNLAHNNISTIAPDGDSSIPVFPEVTSVDLSYNAISTFQFLDVFPTVFPRLTTVRVSHNPLYNDITVEEAHMLTVGRLLMDVTLLNFSKITVLERTNAELYYLSRIAREIAEAGGEEKGDEVVKHHARWTELCELHGKPAIPSAASSVNTSILKNKLLELEFATSTKSLTKRIPPSTSIAALKGLLAKILVQTTPLRIRMTYVAAVAADEEGERVPLEEDTREVGFYVEKGGKVEVEVV